MSAATDRQGRAVINCLLDWADWMRGYRSKSGYPTKSAMIQSGYTSATFEDLCDVADRYRDRVVDSCVDDLPPDQRAAIYRQFLSAAFRMRDFDGSLAAAYVTLKTTLMKKGVIW